MAKNQRPRWITWGLAFVVLGTIYLRCADPPKQDPMPVRSEPPAAAPSPDPPPPSLPPTTPMTTTPKRDVDVRKEAVALLDELRALAAIGAQMKGLRRTFEQAEASAADAASQRRCVQLMSANRERVDAARERGSKLPDSVSSLRLASVAMSNFLTCVDLADESGAEVRRALLAAPREIAAFR